MAVLALVNIDLVERRARLGASTPSQPVTEPGQDARLGMYTRVIAGHLDAQTVDPGLRDRLADLADGAAAPAPRHRPARPGRHRPARSRGRRHPDRAAAATVAATRSSRRTTDRGAVTSDDRSPSGRGLPSGRAGPRRGREGRRRQARRADAGAGRRAGEGPRAPRGLPRPRQDAGRALAGDRAGARLRAGAVHPRPAARRPDRVVPLRPARRHVRVPARAAVHRAAAGRRDQPHAAQDAVGAAGGDAGAAGHGRGRDLPAAEPRSTCSRPPTRSSTKAPTRCPRRSSTAS